MVSKSRVSEGHKRVRTYAIALNSRNSRRTQRVVLFELDQHSATHRSADRLGGEVVEEIIPDGGDKEA